MSGTIGRFGCFSFYPTKNLGGYGDGGMIVTSSDEDADLLMRLRVHGARPKYHHALVGTNSRLDAIQAAFLSVKLKHLDAWADARRRHAAYYAKRFAGTAVTAPKEAPSCHHVYNQFVIRIPNRDALAETLRKAGIGSEIYYPVPMHLQECFRYLGGKEGDHLVSEQAARETLSIPVHPGMTSATMDTVVDTILATL
jgi:dTDP-4-amino-4,6-dideoxygalactose transaminase